MDANEIGIEGLVKNYVHPNRISVLGAGLSIASAASLYFDSTKHIAPLIYGFGAFSDYLDGRVAREFDLMTKEGAKIDPLMDKIKNLAIGSYMIVNEFKDNYFLVIANLANFTVDYISQKTRGPIFSQLAETYDAVVCPSNSTKDTDKKSSVRANYYGKTKTVLQNIVHAGYITSIAYNNEIIDFLNIPSQEFNHFVNGSCSTLLALSAAFGIKGIYNRINK